MIDIDALFNSLGGTVQQTNASKLPKALIRLLSENPMVADPVVMLRYVQAAPGGLQEALLSLAAPQEREAIDREVTAAARRQSRQGAPVAVLTFRNFKSYATYHGETNPDEDFL